MYCSNCGSHLEEGATFCPECGASIYKEKKNEETNVYAIIGFIVSLVSFIPIFFCSLIGMALSIVGLVKSNREGYGQKGLAIAGIIISAITFLGFILLIRFAISLFGGLGMGLHEFYSF